MASIAVSGGEVVVRLSKIGPPPPPTESGVGGAVLEVSSKYVTKLVRSEVLIDWEIKEDGGSFSKDSIVQSPSVVVVSDPPLAMVVALLDAAGSLSNSRLPRRVKVGVISSGKLDS